MARDGWSRALLAGSRISERNVIASAVPAEKVSLLRYLAPTEDALALRLTLKPIERADGVPLFGSTAGNPLVSSPPFVQGLRGGWAGEDISMPIPHPVFGTPIYGVVEWGVGEASKSQLLCDWPFYGASIELVANNVQVYTALGSDPNTDTTANPALTCEVGPSQGMGYNDEPLTLTQVVDLGAPQRLVAVPEYARSVVIAVADTIAAGDFFTVTFRGPFTAFPVWSTRLGFADRLPVELPIPGVGAAMQIEGTGASAESQVVFLQWRIAP